LRKDREIVLAAVQQNGYVLEYADESFKKDKEVVLAAVQQNGNALKYADESLQNDPDILAIVNKNK
jgi:predicted RNA-binding protein (virulence factor B family)